jgi:hypothetical protein
MVSEPGTVSPVLFDDSENVVPPLGAGWVVVMVQELAAPDVRVVGVHASENWLVPPVPEAAARNAAICAR